MDSVNVHMQSVYLYGTMETVVRVRMDLFKEGPPVVTDDLGNDYLRMGDDGIHYLYSVKSVKGGPAKVTAKGKLRLKKDKLGLREKLLMLVRVAEKVVAMAGPSDDDIYCGICGDYGGHDPDCPYPDAKAALPYFKGV